MLQKKLAYTYGLAQALTSIPKYQVVVFQAGSSAIKHSFVPLILLS